jgi:hypothetical protein
MTAFPVLLAQRRAARRRAALDTAAIGLPLVLLATAVAWRLAGMWALLAVGALGIAALAFVASRRARRLDSGWMIGELDRRIARFEDSSALLFADARDLGGFASLQRGRLEARIAEAATVDLRPAWSRRWIASSWGAGVVLILAVLIWPEPGQPLLAPQNATASSPAGAPRITGARLRIVPPAYTGLPARQQSALDARAPEGSRIEWVVGFAPAPASASVAFPDSAPSALVRSGAGWSAGRTVQASTLYRIEAEGLPRQRLHRIDVVTDAAPVVRAVTPEAQLAMVTPGQTGWTPVFEATDDYGVQAVATLRITVTGGDGENITFNQRATTLRGRGDGRTRRFSTTLDLAREGMAPGSDMIVQLVVSDNRAPQRQVVEGPSVILRWPSNLGMAEGLDGMMQRVMPAYFRSQRQIIIDAEALIAQRRSLEAERFMDRSDELGHDQAQLRLRYGQFMGEEAEGGGGGIALPTNDAPPARPGLPTNDAPAPAVGSGHDDHADEDHAEGQAPAFGGDVDALHAYGHAHDDGEAATLFDPGTRSTLSLALDAMWGSERALRQGQPEDALPFAYRALELLKEAQQATRIFLARTGSNLPPIDLSRRLTGKREGIVAGDLAAAPREPADPTLVEAWRALEEGPGAGAPLRLDALDRWASANRARLSDPLALSAAIDTVRNEPGCVPCRRRLRALVWTALERPPAGIQRRAAPGARGRRYLEALQ